MKAESLSVSVRLRRLKTETAHVSVPITEEVMRSDENGGRKLDSDKILEAALQLGKLEATEWEMEEEPEIQPHPIQTPPGKPSRS